MQQFPAACVVPDMLHATHAAQCVHTHLHNIFGVRYNAQGGVSSPCSGYIVYQMRRALITQTDAARERWGETMAKSERERDSDYVCVCVQSCMCCPLAGPPPPPPRPRPSPSLLRAANISFCQAAAGVAGICIYMQILCAQRILHFST